MDLAHCELTEASKKIFFLKPISAEKSTRQSLQSWEMKQFNLKKWKFGLIELIQEVLDGYN